MANANRLFKSAFQISPAALAITCASTGRYIDVNDSWLKLYGFSREEVIGKTSKELNIFLENYADRETAVSLIIKQGSVHNREINTNTKTGKLLHVLYSAEIVRVENETFILSSTIDVTERKKAEKFLKESEERFSKAFGSSPAVLTITCAEDNKLVDVNETFLKLTEYSREEVIGRTTRELNLFLDPDKRDRLFAIALKGGGLRNQELVARTKSGKLLNVLFSLESIDIAGQKHVLATIIDITELKKAESVLKESEQLYRTLFENTEDGFQLFKPLYNKDGKPNDLLILKVNKAYERQTGLRAADVVGKTVKDFIPNIEPYWITTYCNVATTGKSVHIENYNQSTDRWYDVYAFLYAKEQVGTLFRDITDHKKAEDALHQSEERFFKAFDSNPAAMTITHLPDGLWVDVNGSFLRLTEYTREEIVGHSSAELHLFVGTCDERAKIIRLIRKQGKVDSLETKARTKTGKPLNLLLSAVKTVLNGQEYAITTQIDLTERKKAEEALQKNELKFRTVADYTYDWEYWIAPDGKLLYVSPSCQRITGFSSYEFINDPHLLRKIIHPNDKEFERHFETIESAGEYNKTFRIITREGKVRWIEHLCQPVLHDGKFSGRRASNRDATDRIMREEAVKRQASLIDLSPNAIIVRAFDGTISFWNKGAEKLYGWTKGEATGKIIHNLLQTVFPKPLKKIEHEIEKNQSWAGNLIHKTKDGKSIEVKSHWLVESSTINEHKNVLETNVDLTDLRRVEAELRDKDRLAAIGATAGMVGHDIRNPLQAVLSDTYLLKDELMTMPECNIKEGVAESLDSIEKNVAYINKIVQDLQDFSRPVTPEYIESNLSKIFVNIFEIVRLPETIKLSNKVKKTEILYADPSLLQRALSNLVTNAIQAMPKGGNLTIESHPKDGQIVITVKDTGMGIPYEIRPKLFTPMMTTKAKGQGFGLAVSKRLIEAMKGTITFESEVGKGTTFIINLPLAQSKSP